MLSIEEGTAAGIFLKAMRARSITKASDCSMSVPATFPAGNLALAFGFEELSEGNARAPSRRCASDPPGSMTT